MKYAELADASSIYNKAFEGYRMNWLKANFGYLVAVIVVAGIALVILSKQLRKRREILDAKRLAEEERAEAVREMLARREAALAEQAEMERAAQEEAAKAQESRHLRRKEEE